MGRNSAANTFGYGWPKGHDGLPVLGRTVSVTAMVLQRAGCVEDVARKQRRCPVGSLKVIQVN